MVRHSRLWSAIPCMVLRGMSGLALLMGSAAAVAGQAAADSPSRLQENVILDVPYVGQSEALCGAAALAMTFRYWGGPPFEPRSLAHLVTDDGRGIVPVDLEGAARDAGWSTRSFSGQVDQLREQVAAGRPVLALIQVAPGRFHYVTVVGWLAGELIYHDPAMSPYQTASVERFERAWEASDRWALLVLPGHETPGGARGGSSLEPDRDRSVDHRVQRSGLPPPAERCAVAVAEAIQLARAGEGQAAQVILKAAERDCPGNALVPRELAAVRLRSGQPAEAVAPAARALAIDPGDTHAAELLAAALYLSGEPEAGLERWRSLGSSRLVDLQLSTPSRTRQHVIVGATGLAVGDTLTARDLSLSSRRIASLPSHAGSRIDFRPSGDDGVAVEVAYVDGPLFPTFPFGVLRVALRAVISEELRVATAAPFRAGERIEAWGRWEPTRPRLGVAAAIPGRVLGPLTWELEGERSRETFGESREEETRNRASFGFSTWSDPALRWGMRVAVDRWRTFGTYLAPTVWAEGHLAGSRLAVSVSGTRWVSFGDRSEFGSLEVLSRWRTNREAVGWAVSGQAGIVVVGDSAPRTLWPGAGRGATRPGAARAHRLAEDGVIVGSLFGRSMGYGTVEVTRWITAREMAALGAAAFLDVAGVDRRDPGALGERLQADAGLGLRFALPNEGGFVRLDFAYGLRDGATAVSAGLSPGWFDPRP